MFSGKTDELFRRIRRYRIAKKECLVIKYEADTRYDGTHASTHDLVKLEALSCLKLADIDPNLLFQTQVLGIDEGQFYPDIVEFCEKWANLGKTVIVSALDGTYDRRPFGMIANLIPLSESVVKLKAVCQKCFHEASFTKRLGQDKAIELIGGSEMYTARCRKCYHIEEESVSLSE